MQLDLCWIVLPQKRMGRLPSELDNSFPKDVIPEHLLPGGAGHVSFTFNWTNNYEHFRTN